MSPSYCNLTKVFRLLIGAESELEMFLFHINLVCNLIALISSFDFKFKLLHKRKLVLKQKYRFKTTLNNSINTVKLVDWSGGRRLPRE